jgi:glycosyltransferase involved in cell wall biosynthesis
MKPERIALGYDVVDNAHFERRAKSARSQRKTRNLLELPEDYFLVVSRFVKKKNIATLLEAYALFRDQKDNPPDLVVVGSGPEEENLRALASSGVTFRSFASYDEVPVIMGLARGLVLPSKTEQWGLVVNEAMAAGCPVLVSTNAGVVEIIEDGVNGFVAEPEAADLAHGLSRMFAADLSSIRHKAAQDISAWGPDRFASGLISKNSGNRPHSYLVAKLLTLLLRHLASRSIGQSEYD